MPRLFFDTSALVKRYYEEEGSETVDGLVEAEGNEVVITSLSVVETALALRRSDASRIGVNSRGRGSIAF